jgi:hypothetical protein
MDLPELDHVDITDKGDYLLVSPVWKGVDRPHTGGTAVKNMKEAKRLEAAILAGKAVTPDGIKADIYGKTFVVTTSHFRSRCLNADLKRLGF